MDVSKLPKLSGNKNDSGAVAGSNPDAMPPASDSATSGPVGARPLSYATPPGPVLGAEVWFSAIIGLIFIALGWSFGRYLIGTLTHQTFHTGVDWTSGPLSGTEVSYWDLQGGTALSDSAIFLIGVALLVDAACLAFSIRKAGSNRSLILFSFGLMVLAVAYNAIVAVKLLNLGITPILSLLAIALGGYSIFYQWSILRSVSTARR